MIRAITDLADSGLILPLCVLLTVFLWLMESRRAAWLFLRALAVCLLAMTVLKLTFISCGEAIGSSVISPSGHTSLAVFFFGSVATLFYARQQGRERWIAPALALALAVAVGETRLLLSAHNLAEVMFGATVGGLALTLFLRPYLRLSHPPLAFHRLLLAMLPIFLLCYGSALPAENLIRAVVLQLRPSACTD